MASVIFHSPATHRHRISSDTQQNSKTILTSHYSNRFSPLVANHREKFNNLKIQPYKKKRANSITTTSQPFASVNFSQSIPFGSMGPWPATNSVDQGDTAEGEQYSPNVYQQPLYGFYQQGNVSSTQGLERPIIPVPSQRIISSDPNETEMYYDFNMMEMRNIKGKGREEEIVTVLPLDPRQHELIVAQQPIHARMCGFGEKDRRPIDPPPIIQLVVHDEYGKIEDAKELSKEFYVLHVTLWSENGLEERSLIDTTPKVTRVLMGTLVSSPTVLKDPSGEQGLYFAFPDLSIRTEGRYTLRFNLLKIGGVDGLFPTKSFTLSQIFSAPFTVYSAKKFPGMTESTDISKTFAKQGLKIPIRNEVRAKKSD